MSAPKADRATVEREQRIQEAILAVLAGFSETTAEQRRGIAGYVRLCHESKARLQGRA